MILSMEQLVRFFSPLDAATDDTMPAVEVSCVYHWDGKTPPNDNPLYIISTAALNQIPDFDEKKEWVFVAQENEPLSERIRDLRNVHVIVIPGEHSMGEISNKANYVFFQSNNLLTHYDQVLSAVSKSDNFFRVASTISALTNCPIALIAGTQQVLSSCEHDLDKDAWESFLSNRLLKLLQIPEKLVYENFYIDPLPFALGEYEYEVIFPILTDDYAHQRVGMMYLLCSDPVVPASFANLLSFTAYTMSWLFTRYANKDNAKKLSNQQMTFMLTDLLHGIVPSDATFRRVLNNLSFRTDRELVLVCIRTSSSGKQHDFKGAKKVFLEFFEDSFSFTFSADIFILTTPDWLRPDQKKIQNKFTQKLEETECYAGISSIFFSIDKYFIYHFSRALAAADIAAQLKEGRRWTDFRAVSLLTIFNNNYASIAHLCDPALIELVEYDKAHESDNLYTLCCYWQLSKDIARICDFLHIHKNTLYYRLRKISAILKQDINDYDNFVQLILSINILENLGIIPRYRIFDAERSKDKWKSPEEYVNE